MGYPHQMIVHHIGKIIGREAVALYQYHIVKLRIVHGDITVDIIMEYSRAFGGIILPYHKRHAAFKLLLHLFFDKLQTVLVVDGYLLVRALDPSL